MISPKISENKKLLIALLMLCAISSGYAIGACNNTIASSLSVENARPYQDINKTFTVTAHYLDSAGHAVINDTKVNVTITFQNVTTGMTNTTGGWTAGIRSNTTEDVTFQINATADNYTCQTFSWITKFRTPFFVTFQLYKTPLNDTVPQQYTNEFQYVVLTDKNQVNTLLVSAATFSYASTNILNSIFGAVGAPGVPNTNNDTSIYFWGAYSAGQATVKLYEPSNYSVYVMNNKVTYSVITFSEFQRPTFGAPDYLGLVDSNLGLYNQTNLSNTPYALNNSVVKVSLTKFEANSLSEFWRWIKIGVVIIIYVAIMITLAYAFSGTPQSIQILLIVGFSLGGLALLIIRSF